MEMGNIAVLIPIAALARVSTFEATRMINMHSLWLGASRHPLSGFALNTYTLTNLAFYIWIVLVGFKISVLQAVIIVIANFVVMFGVLGPIIRTIGTQNSWTGMAGLLAVWPLTIALYVLVLWR